MRKILISREEYPKCSVFKTIYDATTEVSSSLKDIYRHITSNKILGKRIRRIRQLEKRNMAWQVNYHKKLLPNFIPTGIYEIRGLECLNEYSGYISVDIDNYQGSLHNLKESLKKESDIALMFISPQSNGLKIIHKIKYNQSHIYSFHEKAFVLLTKYYLKEYGIQIDKRCGSLSHACYFSHDPMAYYNGTPTRRFIEYKPVPLF